MGSRTGRETIGFEWTLHPPRASHEAAETVDTLIRFCGGSSVVRFSICEANKINLMKVEDRGKERDKRYRDYAGGGTEIFEEQGGQQENGG